MGLVINIARSLAYHNPAELDEFIQLGRIGLLKAIRKYNPKLGNLSTIAWHYIQGEIKKAIRKNSRYNPVEIIETGYEPSENFWELLPDTLTENERKIIELKVQGYTFEEISNEIELTKSWVHMLFKRAIKKIQNANKEENINL